MQQQCLKGCCRVVVIGLLCHTKEADLLFDGPMARSMDRNIDIETLMFGALEVVDTRVLLDVNYARIYRIAEKIARGLEFSTKGAMFPVSQQFEVDFAEVTSPSDVVKYAPDFTYGCLGGRWEFTFFDSLRFLVKPK